MRRSERREEPEESREVAIIDNRDRGRRFEAEKSKKDKMWTEITKDLVSEEALKDAGMEYEETPDFYYVMEYLRYVSLPTSPTPIIQSMTYQHLPLVPSPKQRRSSLTVNGK